jgi:tetratricopeptide (TPR) repeat protein
MKKTITIAFILLFFCSCQYFRPAVYKGPSHYDRLWSQSLDLIKEQKLDEAEVLLKELYSSAQAVDPELSTKALFEIGQIEERRGDWVAALSRFKECEMKKQDLPAYKAQLELPTRLAGLYATLGELTLSEAYAKKAEMNLQTYLLQVGLINQNSWWAEAFFRMGSFPVQSMNDQNWNEFSSRFHSTSQYLVRSMELSDPLWSERSFELAQNYFKKSFELLAYSSSDYQENSVILGQVIKERINTLETIVRKIEMHRPFELDKSRIASLFYDSLELYKAQLKNKLSQVKDSAPLSKESEKRKAIRRELKIKDPASPQVDNSQKDPNM